MRRLTCWLAGAVLVAAGLLKAWGAWRGDTATLATGEAWPVGLGIAEACLGTWLAGWGSRTTGSATAARWIGLVTFAIFAGAAGWFWASGASACSCFGPLTVDPRWTLLLDVTLTGLLAYTLRGDQARPSVARSQAVAAWGLREPTAGGVEPGPRASGLPRWVLGTSLGLGLLSGWLAARGLTIEKATASSLFSHVGTDPGSPDSNDAEASLASRLLQSLVRDRLGLGVLGINSSDRRDETGRFHAAEVGTAKGENSRTADLAKAWPPTDRSLLLEARQILLGGKLTAEVPNDLPFADDPHWREVGIEELSHLADQYGAECPVGILEDDTGLRWVVTGVVRQTDGEAFEVVLGSQAVGLVSATPFDFPDSATFWVPAVLRDQSEVRLPVGNERIGFQRLWHTCGQVPPGANPKVVFRWHNRGSTAVTLAGVAPSCGCLQVATSATNLTPGQSATVEVTVGRGTGRTLAHTVQLHFRDGPADGVRLRIWGRQERGMEVAPTLVAFGEASLAANATSQHHPNSAPSTASNRMERAGHRFPGALRWDGAERLVRLTESDEDRFEIVRVECPPQVRQVGPIHTETDPAGRRTYYLRLALVELSAESGDAARTGRPGGPTRLLVHTTSRLRPQVEIPVRYPASWTVQKEESPGNYRSDSNFDIGRVTGVER